MSSDSTHLSQEMLEPDGYLAPTRYKITYRCGRCGKDFSRITTKLGGKDPPCPKKACKDAALDEEITRRASNLAKMLEEQRPPGHIGHNVTNRAIDATAEIVMSDHKLTDLKDNLRMGDTLAPQLPPQMQKAADGFFGGAAVKEKMTHHQKKLQSLGRLAINGAFRSTAANPAQILGNRTPGEAALRSLGPDPMSRQRP